MAECPSYKLASPTLAGLTRAEALIQLATKPIDVSKQLKNITGYSDADWPEDPMKRKSTFCTLCLPENETHTHTRFLFIQDLAMPWIGQ